MSIAICVVAIQAGLGFCLLLSLWGAVYYVYLGILTVSSLRLTRPPPSHDKIPLRFVIVVPAHNEEAMIEETVKGLLLQTETGERFEVIVVADNCTDATAELAEKAGAKVLVRENPDLRAKGYALDHAFQHVLADPEVDAVVIVDADSQLKPGSLSTFGNAIRSGAQAIQGRYAVRNPNDGWRTLLMAVAMGAYNDVRSRGRESLGLSCGLLGNGMCFTSRLLNEVPFSAHGLVEDAEYTIRLARAGIRVRHEMGAGVSSEMPNEGEAARSQRIRWESGRIALRKKEAWPLLAEGLRKRNAVLFELGLDLLTPPLASIVMILFLGFATALWVSFQADFTYHVVVPPVAGIMIVAAYVLRGWQLSGTGIRGLAALAMAPAYVAWKIAFTAGRNADSWVRTKRGSSQM